jgi:hypothetical protein
MTEPKMASLFRIVLVPGLITLGVTLLRLVGELQQWSPRLFNRAPGGGAALVGIAWLIPLLGIYFALKLDQSGEVPARLGPVFGWTLLAFAFNTALAILTFSKVPSPVAQLGIFAVASLVAVAIAWRAWPSLWRILVAYGVVARVPVLVIMFISIFGAWDTHYSKPRPDFPAMGPWGLFLWTALLPQFSIWIYMTVVGGLLFGAAAVGFQRLAGRGRSTDQTASMGPSH